MTPSITSPISMTAIWLAITKVFVISVAELTGIEIEMLRPKSPVNKPQVPAQAMAMNQSIAARV